MAQTVEEAKKMAERAGFEPAVEFDPYDGLANRSFRPLRHLSAEKPYHYTPYIRFLQPKKTFFCEFSLFFTVRRPKNDLSFLFSGRSGRSAARPHGSPESNALAEK